MSYLVLARKFRPQTFHSVVGQEHVTRALQNAILRERVPHALLFTGPRGVGKTSAARILAKALNCKRAPETLEGLSEEDAREKIEPCGECQNCVEIAKSTSLAVREIDGASSNSVDNVRELIESLRSLPPPGSRYKIYIIDEVHMLSTAAFNALLKSLEEPPPNTLFVFATTEPHKIPDTVISRCQRHDFHTLSLERIMGRLSEITEAEGAVVPEEVIELVALKAQGSMRDAQTMFDRLLALSSEELDLPRAQQLFGLVDKEIYFRLTTAIAAKDSLQCFAILDEVFSSSVNLRSFVVDFVAHWRNLLVCKAASEGREKVSDGVLRDMLRVQRSDIPRLQEQASSFESFDLHRLFELAESVGNQTLVSSFPRYALEAGVAKMCHTPTLKPLGELMSRLEALGSGNGGQAVRQAVKPQPVSGRLNSAPAAPAKSSQLFNPSWEAFVTHVQQSGGVVLAAHLRRVSAEHFSEGSLKLVGPKFDIDAISQGDGLQLFRKCLSTYSDCEKWDLKFSEANGESASGQDERSPAKGSLAAMEREAVQQRHRRIEQEARSNPAVQSALSVFPGSRIEKVLLLHDEREVEEP